MPLPKAVQGGRRPSPVITWNQEDSTPTNPKPENLTGATMTGFIRRGRGESTTVPITGTLTVLNGQNGTFRWDLSALDVSQSGTFFVQFVATFPGNDSPAKSFVTKWQVEEALDDDIV